MNNEYVHIRTAEHTLNANEKKKPNKSGEDMKFNAMRQFGTYRGNDTVPCYLHT